tara:strand:+ start:2817 stop:3938 length:1122 start_codon:yes stop_codon:yes gene_type:complete
MRKRWWLFRLFDRVARDWLIMRLRRGLLVIRMDGIGDMVIFRNSLDDYSEAFGVKISEITILGCNSWGSVAQQIFEGYRVVTIDEHKYARHLFYRIFVNLRVRRINPAVTICDAYFRRTLMADSLARVAGAPKTIMSLPYLNGDTRAEFTWYLSQCSEIIDTGPYPRHEIERHAAFTSLYLDRPPDVRPPALNWRNKEPYITEGKTYAVLNPGSNEHGRRWPLVQFVALATWLADKGLCVVFIGKSEEKVGGNLVSAVADGEKIIDLTGQTDLPETFDIMKHSKLVVSNDTGPAHVAIGLGVPTVVVVGGGHFGCFVPYPESARPKTARFVYEYMECYHCFWRCHKREDPSAPFPCVASVSSEKVRRACEELI